MSSEKEFDLDNECDFCKMTEEVRKQNIIIEDWNNKQK